MTPTGFATPGLSLFDKYGGLSGLRLAIMDFYDRVLDSDVVGHFFDDVDMPRLIDHQTKFVAALLGGPAEYSDDRLARAHARLTVNDAEFDEIVHLMEATLTQAGFAPPDLAAVLRAVEARRGLIVTERRTC